MEQTKILQELIASPVFEGNLILQPIVGGTINQSYILTNKDTRYFLKTFERNHFTPSDRQAIYYLQEQLSEHKRAARPFYLSKNHDFQVEEWIEHVSLAKCSLSKEQKIRLLAETLYAVHLLPAYANSVDFQSDWNTYLQMAAIKPDEKLQTRMSQCKAVWFDSLKHDQVLCHNDLAMEHIAVDEHPVIFDWEYAACGSRYFDIAACAHINRLTPLEIRQLLHDYSDVSAMPLDDLVAQTTEQFPLVELTNELWYLAVGVSEPV